MAQRIVHICDKCKCESTDSTGWLEIAIPRPYDVNEMEANLHTRCYREHIAKKYIVCTNCRINYFGFIKEQ